MTVQRVIGGIQINNDLETILGQAARTLQQKGVFDRLMVGADFMAAGIFIVAKFKPVQCRSAGQRLALILGSTSASKRILFTDSHGKEWIEPQQIMIIEILVARGQAQQTLGDQFAHGVFGKERVTMIAKATSQAARDAQALINLAQQQHAAISTDMSRREVSNDLT